MKITPPTKLVFWLSTVIAVLGILGKFITLPFISMYYCWLLLVAFVLLWLGNVFKGL